MIEYAKPRPVRCANGRRHHRWLEVATRSIGTRPLIDPELRVCKFCPAIGHVNKQGIVELVEVAS